MRITIKLYSMLRSYLGENEKGVAQREFPDGAIIADVVASLGIPEKIPRITLINGEQKEAGDALSEGDVLSVFPPIAGG
jgi:molybdopterin converting factor small subunit